MKSILQRCFVTSLSILLVLTLAKNTIAQPAIQWQRSYGGLYPDFAYASAATSDSGFIIAGYTHSDDFYVSGNHGLYDAWIVKISSTSDVQWQKCLGGTSFDFASSVQQTTDGGYIFAGASQSHDSDLTANYGGYDYWVVKLSSTGNIQWQKNFGGSGDDEAYCVRQTTDGGYIVGGYSNSHDSEVTGNHSGYDYWVIKLTSSGGIQWEHSYGGSGNDLCFSVLQATDGGYVLCGYAESSDGDVSNDHGGQDYWLVKTNETGEIEWQRSYGGSGDDEASSVLQTSDGGYIIAGNSRSYDGDITRPNGSLDFWIVKTDDTGGLQWQNSFGGTLDDGATSILQNPDSSYVVVGYTNSDDREVTSEFGLQDEWVIKLAPDGSLIWQKCMGGSDDEGATSVVKTLDERYFVCGSSASQDHDVTENYGSYDYWVVMLDPRVNVPTVSNAGKISIAPNPTVDAVSVIGAANLRIQVYDVTGRLLKEAGNTDNILISSLPAAVYFIKLFDSQGHLLYQDKIVKE